MIIYLITNTLNGKKYVGQTVQPLQKRMRAHRWISSSTQKNMPIAHAIQKHGWSNFEVEVLCNCNSQEELNEKEVFYSRLHNTMSPDGYNLRVGNGPGTMAESTKAKISASNTGKVVSEETKQKSSLAHQGQTLSEVNKEKLRQMYKGQKLSDLAYQNALKATVKTYQFLNPAGEPQTVTNLREFCRVQDLNYLSMHKVAAGRRKSHKGWSKFSGKNFV